MLYDGESGGGWKGTDDMNYIALDLETTGLSPENCYILEIGAIKIIEDTIAETYETFVQCPIPISEKIQELTGITDEMAAQGKTEAEAVQGFIDFASDLALLGHNIPFDYAFIQEAVKRSHLLYEAPVIDTLQIARKVLAQPEKKSLVSLCDFYHIKTETSHRALADAKAAVELYKILRQEYGSQEELFCPHRVKEHVRSRKQEPITEAQKRYLNSLLRFHRLTLELPIEELSKSEASRRINEIIRGYGRNR